MALRFLTAGESHGPALVAILEGLPSGLPLGPDVIDRQLARRQQGFGAGPRMKIERDRVRILAGVLAGETIGSPLAMLIENEDHAQWSGKPIAPFTIPRPGHADLVATLKYGYRDLRPALERASARETAVRVAVGAVCCHLLAQVGIAVGGYVRSIGAVEGDVDGIPLVERARLAEGTEVRCPDVEAAKLMKHEIERAAQEKDTLGGIIEIFLLGVPPGLGSHVQWDRRLDARLGAALLGVQAIKGIEFGQAFADARLRGTMVHDAIRLDDGELMRPTNHAGGIEGGITTGQPLLMRVAMKPIASTLAPQPSVDLLDGHETVTGCVRSDICPVPRAVPILEAVAGTVVADALLEKLGGDTLEEIRSRCQGLARARLSDTHMDGAEHVFWPPGDSQRPG